MNILAIDDDSDYLDLLGKKLKGKEHRLFKSKNPRNGLSHAIIWDPDIILLDVFIPIENGYQACNDFKKNKDTKDIPIILISGMVEEDFKGISDLIGYYRFFSKSEGIDKLIQLCEEINEHRNQNKDW